MTGELLAAYERGEIVAGHLIAEVFFLVDPADPGLALKPLPQEVLRRMHRLTLGYQAERVVSNYGQELTATDAQAEAARHWIEANLPAEWAGEAVPA